MPARPLKLQRTVRLMALRERIWHQPHQCRARASPSHQLTSPDEAASVTAGVCTFSVPGEMAKRDNADPRTELKSSLVAPELQE